MSIEQFDEMLSAISNEMAQVQSQRTETLAQIGERVLPQIRENAEYADLAAKIDDLEAQSETLNRRETALLAEKVQFEREEKERIAKYTCSQCKVLNKEDARFCEECGNPVGFLPREFCKACCTMNPPGLKFCGECGTKLPEIENG
ncbi:MAG: zinc ribbon domain-containing protein [Oscillospiraceae bacterium]|nr:zinc ribbon domain-containing protein [Oscillospiraceae bacterium]